MQLYIYLFKKMNNLQDIL